MLTAGRQKRAPIFREHRSAAQLPGCAREVTVEYVAEMPDDCVLYVLQRHGMPEQCLERCDAVLGDATGNDEPKEIEVGVHVECEPMAGHPARDADADCPDLLRSARRSHPRARQSGNPARCHAEIRADADHQLLEIPNVSVHIAAIWLEVDDRITHELPRAVIGHIAPATRFAHLDTLCGEHLGCSHDVRAGAIGLYAERDDMRMLQEEKDVRRPARLAIVDERPLQCECICVGHDPEAANFKGLRHAVPGCLRIKGRADAMSSTESRSGSNWPRAG